jgi:hypothetical protein
MKVKSVKIIQIPNKWYASNAAVDEVDKNLIKKKLNKYGFFDENGKWKEK